MQFKFDRKCKNAKHRCHQQIYYKLRNSWGGYSVLVNYQYFLSNLFSLALHPPVIFLYKLYTKQGPHDSNFLVRFN